MRGRGQLTSHTFAGHFNSAKMTGRRKGRHKFAKAEEVILLSRDEVNGPEIRKTFLKQIKRLKSLGLISNSPLTRCLMISGSHQDEQGASVLSYLDYQEEKFFRKDCNEIGIEIETTNTVGKENLPLAAADIPDICHVRKLGNPQPGSFYADPEVNQMTFQVLNAALYHKNIDKMIQDIATFNPDVIMIGWCYSQFGDLSLALRRSAHFSKMIITHDLRKVTKKHIAKLDHVQDKLLMQLGINCKIVSILHGNIFC